MVLMTHIVNLLLALYFNRICLISAVKQYGGKKSTFLITPGFKMHYQYDSSKCFPNNLIYGPCSFLVYIQI